MSEIVFILGAGASKEAGAPLMADFLDKADELRRGGKLKQFKPDFDRVLDAISTLQSVHSKVELYLDNIESVFAAFKMGQLIKRLPAMSSDDIDLLLVSIRRLIFKILEETVAYPVRSGRIYPNDSYNLFAKLINVLNDDGKQNRCSILKNKHLMRLLILLVRNSQANIEGQRLTQHKRFVSDGTDPNFCFTKTPFIRETLDATPCPVKKLLSTTRIAYIQDNYYAG